MPCSADQGGLSSFQPFSASIISASTRDAASCMPNGVVLALSPHLSVWDRSLAAECDEAVWAPATVAAAAATPPGLDGSRLQAQPQPQAPGAGACATASKEMPARLAAQGASSAVDTGLQPVNGAARANGLGGAAEQAVWTAAAAAVVASNALPAATVNDAAAAGAAARGVPGEAGAASAGAGPEMAQGAEGGAVQVADGLAMPAGAVTEVAGLQGASVAGQHGAPTPPQLAAVLKLRALQGLQVGGDAHMSGKAHPCDVRRGTPLRSGTPCTPRLWGRGRRSRSGAARMMHAHERVGADWRVRVCA